MSERKEYTDDQGRKFYYQSGGRVYLDGGADAGASVKFTPANDIEGFTRDGPVWRKNAPLKTTYGDFEIQLMGGKPDKQTIRLAASAEAYVQKHIESVVDIVFGHYQWATKTWGRDAVTEMPNSTNRKNILSHIPSRMISVDRLDDDEYLCAITFDIPYDPEHGLQLEFEDGKIVSVNDGEFTLENGCLKFD